MPTFLPDRRRRDRPALAARLAEGATLALMFGTACLGAELLRDIGWRVTHLPALSANTCDGSLARHPRLRRSPEMQACRMLEQEQGF